MTGGRRALPAPRRTPAAADRNLALYLSLFLILAAFFLLLNSLSQREAGRTSAAVGGVALAFGGPAKPRDIPPPDAPAIAWAAASAQALGALLPLGTLTLAPHPHGVRIALSTDALFVGEEAGLRPDRLALLERLAERMQQAPAGSRPTIELRLNAADRLGPARAEMLMRVLIGRNLASDAVTIGLAPGTMHTLELLLAARPAHRSMPARLAEVRR